MKATKAVPYTYGPRADSAWSLARRHRMACPNRTPNGQTSASASGSRTTTSAKSSEVTPDGWSLEVEVPLAYEFQFEKPVPYRHRRWVDGAPVIRSRLAGGFVLSGHIDSCSINPDATEAIGWDLKTGYDPVDPADQNWQILGYAVL